MSLRLTGRRAGSYLVCAFLLAAAAAACSNDMVGPGTPPGGEGDTGEVVTPSYEGGISGSIAQVLADNLPSHEVAADYTWDAGSVVPIILDGTTATGGEGVSVSGSTVTISSAGTYHLSGQLTNGRVVVSADDDDLVRLVLDGVDITTADQAPIAITDAGRAMVYLAPGSVNRLTDGSSYAFEGDDDEPNAALFSKTDLTIAGSGSLDVRANYNDGISSKDGLVIASGVISVNAADDAVRGKDYVIVKGGTLTLTAGGDGIKADNEKDATAGYFYMQGGRVDIVSADDGVDAATDLLIAGGTLNVTAGGGAAAVGTTEAKGIKAGARIVAEGGTVDVDASDDAVHSNAHILINDGTFTLATGDDAVHADTTLGVNGGAITVTRSYEGLESSLIVIKGGEIRVASSDDGVNAAGDESGRFGNNAIEIHGGRLFVDAEGDGMDANGSIIMTAGLVVVNGPTVSMNGAIDYDRSFQMTGGFLVAAGSAGMAQAPGSASTQPSLLLISGSTRAAGTMIHIQAGDGTGVLSFAPTKRYQAVAFSSPGLAKGTSYEVYVGGTSTGTPDASGLYETGAHAGGTRSSSFTISSVVTRMSF